VKTWFEIKVQADQASADIYIFDLIGDWIDDLWGFDGVTTAKSFVAELAKLQASVKTLRVHLNSPGGDIFGGVTIANTLRAEQANGRRVETIIEGLAASAASIIAMGGNPVRIADNGLLMVHAPWSVAIGNATEMRATADRLDQLRDTLVKTYQWHSQLSAEEIVALIDGNDHQGTWLDADAAIEAGFATEKIEGLKAAASINPKGTAKLTIPEKFKARVEALLKKDDPAPPTPVAASASDILAAVETAGLGTAFARELVVAALPMEQVTARVTAAKADKTQRETRATAIRSLCATAKLPELADGYVNGGISVDDVRAHLTTVTAKVDKAEIDTGLKPDHGARSKSDLSARDIYAERNRPATTNKE